MAIDLKTLLRAAPFEEKTRKDLLKRIETMTEEQKVELSNGCWDILSQMYHAQAKIEHDKLRYEIATGKKKFNKDDFDAIDERLTHELAKKLDAAESSSEIEQIRKQLADHQKFVASASHPKHKAQKPHKPSKGFHVGVSK